MAFRQNVGLAVSIIGPDQLIAEPQFTAKVARPGLFGDERIRAGLDDASVDVFGAKDAAQTRRRFVENIVQIAAGTAAFFEREGGGEP